MTIAACHLSPEGVVLGADSTTTVVREGKKSYLDHAQKIFEIGPSQSTMGLVTWGLGQIGDESHRTIAALIGQQHQDHPFPSVQKAAEFTAALLWDRLTSSFGDVFTKAREAYGRFEAGEATEDDFKYLTQVDILSGGYCIAGRTSEIGPCDATIIEWLPWLDSPEISPIPLPNTQFWGQPWVMHRLIMGWDEDTLAMIYQSDKWVGTEEELMDIVFAHAPLILPDYLPIREASDWIHTVIHTTIRGVKFAQKEHVCGGPVEIAVITTDRPFRWVCHKTMDSAIMTAREA